MFIDIQELLKFILMYVMVQHSTPNQFFVNHVLGKTDLLDDISLYDISHRNHNGQMFSKKDHKSNDDKMTKSVRATTEGTMVLKT